MKKIITSIMLAVVFAISVFIASGLAVAESSISRGYATKDTGLGVGMAVALSDDSTDKIQYIVLASSENKSKYIGITTSVEDSLVSVTDSGSTVLVTDSGQHDVYVSDINGEVKRGDVLVVSPLKGILMRRASDTSNDTVVAVALSDSGSSNSSEKKVLLKDGTAKNTAISTINAELNTTSILQGGSGSFLSFIGESIAGKPVSEIRVLIACLIVLFLLILEGSIAYSSVSYSIIAIGRNPLSKQLIFKQLIFTSIVAFLILILGLAGIYVVIWT